MEELTHKEILCACGTTILFGPRDQAWYAQNGWPPPKRCPACREKKKKQMESASHKDLDFLAKHKI